MEIRHRLIRERTTADELFVLDAEFFFLVALGGVRSRDAYARDRRFDVGVDLCDLFAALFERRHHHFAHFCGEKDDKRHEREDYERQPDVYR